MTDEADLLQALAANPADDLLRLVYADWLDENPYLGRTAQAEYLRLEVNRATAPPDRTTAIERRSFRLAQGLPGDWLATAGKRPLENCDGPRFRYACPKQWEALAQTDRVDIRFCGSCQQDVFFCETIDEANDHARQNRCVAISVGQRRQPGDLNPRFVREYVTMGIMAYPEPPPEPVPAPKSMFQRIRRRLGL